MPVSTNWDNRNLFNVFLESHKYLFGMGRKARCTANS